MINLESIRADHALSLKIEYERFISQQKDILIQLPRLYYISNGKGGWLGGVDFWITKNIIPINMDETFISLEDFKIYSVMMGEISKPRIESIFLINPQALDFEKEFKRYKNKAYNDINSTTSQTLELKNWLEKGLMIGLDLDFKDVLAHYNGIVEKYVYEVCRNEKEFLKLKESVIKSLAKECLNLDKAPSYF